MRSSSASFGVDARYGHTCRPSTPWLTAHNTWARSAITSARDGVPLMVCTVVVTSQSGAVSGIRFWKNDWAPTPLG